MLTGSRDCNFKNNIIRQTIECYGNISADSTEIYGDINGRGRVKLCNYSTVQNITSQNVVQILYSTANDIKADGNVLAFNGFLGNVSSKQHVILDYNVSQNVNANKEIRLLFSKVLGNAKSQDKFIALNSTIEGNATAKNIEKLKNSTINGTLSCCNQNLVVINTTGIDLIMLEPEGSSSSRDNPRQTVTLRDAHFKHVIFEKFGGIVNLEGSASVGLVSGGDSYKVGQL